MLLSRRSSSWRQACTRGHTIYRSVSTARRPGALQTYQDKYRVLVETSRRSRSGTICQAAANVSSSAATSTILYVSKLGPTVKGDDLTSHFKNQPGFESAFVMNVADEDGQQECLGYVQFNNPQAAAAAQKALDGSELRQKRIKVRTQRGGSADEDDVQNTDAAGTSGPATPQHTAAITAGTEATSSSATAAEGSDDEDAGIGGAEKPAGMSRSKKHRLRQNAKREGIPKPAANILFVPNLRQETTEEQLIECFREQPGYQSAQLRTRWNRRRDGYVIFDDASAAAAAMEALQGASVNNLPIKIHVHEVLSREKKAEMAAANLAKSQTPPKQQPAAALAAAQGDAGSVHPNDGSPDSSSSSSSSGKQGRGSSKGPRPRVTYSVKVKNLAWSTDADGLSAHFADCPGFWDASTILQEDGRTAGIGFVRFATAEAAKAAMEAKDQTELEGRTIKTFIPQTETAKFEAAAAAAASSSGKNKRRKGGKRAWAVQVSSLAWETTEDDLVEHFKDCQGYTGAFIVTGKDNRPSGIGYVTFDSNEAQLKALEAKQGSELVGRSIKLTLTRTGRVESSKGVDDTGSNAAGSSGTDAALEKTDIVLTGLPASFTYKEVLGLCSYFGEVKSIVRMRGRGSLKASKGSSSAEKDSAAAEAAGGAAADAEAGQAAAKEAAESDREGQPCFVIMASEKAAKAAVGALHGRTVQGCVLKAALATPKKVAKKRARSRAAKQEGEAAEAQATESKAEASSS